jgi:hypothetical protein
MDPLIRQAARDAIVATIDSAIAMVPGDTLPVQIVVSTHTEIGNAYKPVVIVTVIIGEVKDSA